MAQVALLNAPSDLAPADLWHVWNYENTLASVAPISAADGGGTYLCWFSLVSGVWYFNWQDKYVTLSAGQQTDIVNLLDALYP